MNWYWTNVALWITWAAYWFISSRFVERTKASEGWLLRLTHLVPLTASFFLIFHDPHSPLLYGRLYHNEIASLAGTLLAAAGLLFTVWARIHLGKYWSAMITVKQGHQLIRSGPYRLVRHPIYTGFLTAALGSAITAGTVGAFAGFVLMLATCLVKIRRGEKLLISEFGEMYHQFRSEVAMLVPYIA